MTRVVDTCSGCGGIGGVTLKADGVRKHLRMGGISQVSDSVWSRELDGVFERGLMTLYREGDEVSLKLTLELNKECLG
ncbi:hypothetical protein [Enterovibrio norvegicus]|uniref:hypothetical protein n=1 Tax=Enterovibrio norvegicus TaxID=188144 RepID=UPI00354E79D0